ncbi:tripartite motif-containing protein 2-like [Ptychodera flava]|uniref:tripartite motif-containing protein 2-like n=1 Tax=Ptychodera flava TaxID=63121 RepID=UPI00396A6F23
MYHVNTASHCRSVQCQVIKEQKFWMRAMATAESEFLEKINEDFLVCGVCSERYKTAKVLPCLHSFCEQCLFGWVEKTCKLDCPVCRRSHQLPQGGVAKLQSNFFLDQLVEEFNRRDSGSSKSTCDACLGEGGKDDVRCVECSARLCGNCAGAHKRLAASRSHRLIAMDEYVSLKDKDPSLIQAGIYCDRHTDNQVKFYCDTCEVPICSDCTVIDHRIPEHKHRYLQDAAGEYKQVVEKTIKELKVKEKKNDDWKVAIQKVVNKLDASFSEEEKKLQDHVTETIKEITRRIEENGRLLMKQLKDKYETRKDDLTAQLEALDIIANDLANAREFTENLIQYGNAAQLMSAKKNVDAQTQELYKVETGSDPVADELMMFTPCDDYCETKSLGSIHLVECSLTEIPEFCRCGDDVCLGVCLTLEVDLKGLKDAIEAEMIGPLSQRETMTIEDHKNGTYSVKGRTMIEGEHEVLVSLWKRSVCSSRVKVIPKKGLLFELSRKCQGLVEIDGPYGIAVDQIGNTVVCEFKREVITRLSPYKDFHRKMEITHGKYSKVHKPLYVGISADQKLHFVTDIKNKKVLVFDENLQFIRSFKGKIKTPRGIAVNPTNKRVYVADDSLHCIHTFDQDGNQIKSFGGKGNEDGYFNSPEDVCINKDGNVIVSDYRNHRIQVFDADGQFQFAFGSKGDGQGQMQNPFGVTTDRHNNVYVCDRGNKRVLKFDPKGVYICRIDNGEVKKVSGVCVTDDEPFGRVIVSDYVGNSIEVFAQ